MRPYSSNVRGLFGPSATHRQPIQPCVRILEAQSLRFQSSSSSNGGQSKRSTRLNYTSDRRRKSRSQPSALKLEVGVDSLGQPAEIVVVPDRKNQTLKLRDKYQVAPKGNPSVSISSILEDLDDEASDLSMEVVHARLEENRRAYQANQKLAISNWEELRSTLASSFTSEQLSSYLTSFDYTESAPGGDAGRWRPESLVSFQNTEWQESVRNLRGKTMLAERIIRDCWKISLMNEVGQLDLYLPLSSIKLLLNAKHFSFDQLATLHKSGIDITQSLGLVRITGPENACDSIHEIIKDATTRIREENVAIDLATCGPRLTPRFLDWVSQTYNIAIDQSPSKDLLKIFYLTENKDGAENARRTLGIALHATTPTNRPFSTYLPASEPANVYSHVPGSASTWFDRQALWFRWAMPAAQTSAPEIRTPHFDGHQTRLSDELLKVLQSPNKTKINSPTGLTVHESISAAVGKCLFGQKPTFDEKTLSATQLGKLYLPRTFVTDIPRMRPFLDTLEPISHGDGERIHNLRLLPSPGVAGTLPELDVQFVSKPTETSVELELQKVKIILHTNSVDYLLPENGLDLRFTHTVYIEASAETITDPAEYAKFIQSIEQPLQDTFIPKSNATDSWRSHLHSASLPLFGRINLPRKFTQPQSLNADPPVNSNELLANEESQDGSTAEYMFPPIASIEGTTVRQYEFDGRQVNHRFYDNGPFLATQMNEITLNMDLPTASGNPGDVSSNESIEREFHSFYNAACEMAFGLHKPKNA
ncbi:hypothetical protein N7478_006023 [Penicillium angulare]|uniref:uncharacterized protein n=1 Tax=Penicillium angulare TaxID=116970 RepID=UPI0025403138|nr:uncharacterized protein N7478_006023 [Penicillium angulare]KAJ5280651.1 hypothetical protein N7478_006023 [Penicillium angulare]